MEKFILLFLEEQKSSFPQKEPDTTSNPYAQMVEAEDWEDIIRMAYEGRKALEKATGERFRLIQITIGA